MKRVAAILMFDEDTGTVYVVADEVDKNAWIPEISLREAITKANKWECAERGDKSND